MKVKDLIEILSKQDAEMETDFQPSLIVNDGDADWERLDDVLQENAKRETNSLEN